MYETMESENSRGMQSLSSSSGGVGGVDQEYESTGSATAVVGGGNKYNQNLMLNNNIDVTMEYSSSPLMLPLDMNPLLAHDPQSQVPYSFYTDPSFRNMVLRHPQIQPQPRLQLDQVVAASTGSCTTGLVNGEAPPPRLASSEAAAAVTESGAARCRATNAKTLGGSDIDTDSKKPRKRTRASRKAATAVMITDTTNFRAMVQEFTGVPSSPFSFCTTSAPLSRTFTGLFPANITASVSHASGIGISSSYSLRPTATSGSPAPYYGTHVTDPYLTDPHDYSVGLRLQKITSTGSRTNNIPFHSQLPLSSTSSSSSMLSSSASTSLRYQATPAASRNILKSHQQEADHPA